MLRRGETGVLLLGETWISPERGGALGRPRIREMGGTACWDLAAKQLRVLILMAILAAHTEAVVVARSLLRVGRYMAAPAQQVSS